MTKQQERVELVNWFYDTFNEELVDLEIKMERYSKKQTEEQREAFEKARECFINNAFQHQRVKELIKNYAEAKRGSWKVWLHSEDDFTTLKKLTEAKEHLDNYISTLADIITDYLV